MKAPLDKKTMETIVAELVNGELDINELDLHKPVQREAFDAAIEERPVLLTSVRPEYSEHFLTHAIKLRPRYFVYLNRDQYTGALAQEYIASRFDELALTESGYDRNSSLAIQKSLDDKLVFNYSHATAEGEELYYMDHELGVPTSIKSSYKISLKLVDGIALIDKLDTHITQLGAVTIKSTVVDLINNGYREFLSSYITENKVGYYTLSTSYEALRRGFIEKMGAALREYGFAVSDFAINQLAIPKDIQFKLEDQAFQLRQRRAEVEADAEFAKISLDSYEAKLAVQQKYPDADHSLTEYEKDLALKRYLVKINRVTEEEIDRSIKLGRKAVETDSEIRKKVDEVVDIPEKKSNFSRNLGIFAAIAAFISIIVMATQAMAAGLIMLAITAVIVGVATIVHGSGQTASLPAPTAPTEPDEPELTSTPDKDDGEEV